MVEGPSTGGVKMMKKLVSLALMFATFWCGSSVVLSAPTKGVQAILLHCWLDPSVRNLSNVLRHYSKSEVEVSFAPNTSCTASDPYNNIRTIIENLNGKKMLYVAVYLGFHSYHPLTCKAKSHKNDNSDPDLFVSFFNRYKDNPKVKIIVSPSLEDCGSQAEVEASALEIAKKIGPADIGKLILRRSPGFNSDDPPSQCYNDSSAVSCRGDYKYKYRTVEVEKHGVTKVTTGNSVKYILNTSGAKVYSNDGIFVWDDVSKSREKKSTFPNADTTIPQQYSLTDFTKKIEAGDIRTNLWRPAYNMYRQCDGHYYIGIPRDFNDCQNRAFNSVEMTVLKKFLDPYRASALGATVDLSQGDSINSDNDEVTLMFQTDGNVVLYNNDTGEALWNTGTGGRTDATRFIMQSDGNLVLYAGATPLWNAGIISPNAYLAVQDDHNLVVYSGSGAALWNTATTNQ
jgi:hypothetical protein